MEAFLVVTVTVRGGRRYATPIWWAGIKITVQNKELPTQNGNSVAVERLS